jgi:hypothetical protein
MPIHNLKGDQVVVQVGAIQFLVKAMEVQIQLECLSQRASKYSSYFSKVRRKLGLD